MAYEPESIQSSLEEPATESKPQEIREQMEETRTALTDKLETLEERVQGKVEAVKDSVQSAVRTVKRTFDVRYQVERRPWIALGGAVAAGFLVGSLGRRIPPAPRPTRAGLTDRNGAGSAARFSSSAPPPASPGPLSQFRQRFHDEIDLLQSAALGAVMGMVRDWLKEAMPPLAPQLEQAMNSATTKMGGQPIHGPVLRTEG